MFILHNTVISQYMNYLLTVPLPASRRTIIVLRASYLLSVPTSSQMHRISWHPWTVCASVQKQQHNGVYHSACSFVI